MTKDQIRAIFLANGFEVKAGYADLKPYVYEAAEALLRASNNQRWAVIMDAVRAHGSTMTNIEILNLFDKDAFDGCDVIDLYFRSRVADLLHLLSFATITTPSPGDAELAAKIMADLRHLLHNSTMPPQASLSAENRGDALVEGGRDTYKTLLVEIAALKRHNLADHPTGKGRRTTTLNVPNELLERLDAALNAHVDLVTPQDKATQDQMAAVMLQHGTKEQQEAALKYASVEATEAQFNAAMIAFYNCDARDFSASMRAAVNAALRHAG